MQSRNHTDYLCVHIKFQQNPLPVYSSCNTSLQSSNTITIDFADDAQSEGKQTNGLFYLLSLRKSCFDRILSHRLIRFLNL